MLVPPGGFNGWLARLVKKSRSPSTGNLGAPLALPAALGMQAACSSVLRYDSVSPNGIRRYACSSLPLRIAVAHASHADYRIACTALAEAVGRLCRLARDYAPSFYPYAQSMLPFNVAALQACGSHAALEVLPRLPRSRPDATLSPKRLHLPYCGALAISSS